MRKRHRAYLIGLSSLLRNEEWRSVFHAVTCLNEWVIWRIKVIHNANYLLCTKDSRLGWVGTGIAGLISRHSFSVLMLIHFKYLKNIKSKFLNYSMSIQILKILFNQPIFGLHFLMQIFLAQSKQMFRNWEKCCIKTRNSQVQCWVRNKESIHLYPNDTDTKFHFFLIE